MTAALSSGWLMKLSIVGPSLPYDTLRDPSNQCMFAEDFGPWVCDILVHCHNLVCTPPQTQKSALH